MFSRHDDYDMQAENWKNKKENDDNFWPQGTELLHTA